MNHKYAWVIRREFRRRSRVLAGLCLLLSVAAVPLAGAGVANAATGDPQGTIYVADAGTNAIDVFPPGSNGDVAPERVIMGPDTGLNEPGDVKVNAAGDIFVSNFEENSITEYAPQASGDASPICTISGPNTGLDENDDMSILPDGTLVVGNFEDAAGDQGAVTLFQPGSCGDVTPIETIAGPDTGFDTTEGVGTDANGTIYADSSQDESIQVFKPGSNGDVAPEYTISGADTGLGHPDDIIVGFDGKIYATNGFGGPVNSITVYAPGAEGDATPLQDITGANTDFGLPDDLAVDSSGNMFITDSEATVGPAVLEFAAGATGDVAPTAVITGPDTTFSVPEGVFVTGPQNTSSATLTTEAAAQQISPGQSTSDTATLSGGSVAPTGSLVYKLFGPNDPTCSANPAFTSSPTTVNGDGSYPSPSFTPTAAGTYSWVDEYSGDANNAAATSSCEDPAETVLVGVTLTTVTTSLSDGTTSGTSITVPSGTAVTDTATLAGANASTATGTVAYNVYSDSACTDLVDSGSAEPITTAGTAPPSAAVTLANPGTYYWQAVYSGDSANAASASACGPAGEVETVTPVAAPISVSASLSGGGKTGISVSVPAGTAVTDTATLSGTNAGTATGTVTYTVYSDSACAAAVSTGSAQTITTPGTLPASAPVTLSTVGVYYWQASYSGDANNTAAVSTCGSNGEVETVTSVATPTSLNTTLIGPAQSGTSITVPVGTAVRDSAKLSGAHASKASGTVTYKVYSNATCTTLVATADMVTVTGGVVPNSPAQPLPTPGKYYWTAAYSGDSNNGSAASTCGSEVVTVTAAPAKKPVIDTVSSAQGRGSATVNVSTTAAGDLLVAFVAGKGPQGKQQTATVSAGGLKWTFAGRENTGRGDAEVWSARAVGKPHNLHVSAADKYKCWGVTITVVAFRNATGIGKVATSHSSSGAPAGKLTTSKANSWVFAVGDDWLKSALRTVGAGQSIVSQSTDTQQDTYWVQATKTVTPKAGTSVTINDTKPAKDPFNMVLVEIL